MDDAQLQYILSVAEKPKTVRRRISSRRYNVYVHVDGKLVETIEYIATYKRANDIADDYRKSGAKVDIREDVTYDGKGDEIKFYDCNHPSYSSVDRFPLGRQSFTTPTISDKRFAMKLRLKGDKRPKANTSNNKVIKDPHLVPGTWSHNFMIEQMTKRGGYTVQHNGEYVHIGDRDTTYKFLMTYVANHGKNALDNLIVTKLNSKENE